MKPTSLNKEIVKLIIQRLADEYKAFYTYQAISNWANNVGFLKVGKYFHDESEDELKHALRIEGFLNGWNVIPELPVIEQPKLEFKTLIEAIELGYKLELALYTAYDDTCSEVFGMDTAVYNFLSEYLKIQTDSVAEYSDFLNILDGCDTADKFQMLMLEDKLFGN
jgi:ferritin